MPDNVYVWNKNNHFNWIAWKAWNTWTCYKCDTIALGSIWLATVQMCLVYNTHTGNWTTITQGGSNSSFYYKIKMMTCKYTRGPRGPWNAHLRQKIFIRSFFHCFMYNMWHLGGLKLKAIVLKCKSRSKGQVLCYTMSKFWTLNRSSVGRS